MAPEDGTTSPPAAGEAGAGRTPRVGLPPAGTGRRVVVRHRLPDGSATDVLGTLEEDGVVRADGVPAGEGDVLVVRRDGGDLVRVRRDDVLAARPVPPRVRRPAGGTPVVGVLDLEAVLALAWRPGDASRSGRWLLRSAADRTRRASSVLVLGLPEGDLGTAVDRATAWARRHGSTPRFLLPRSTGAPVGAAARADAAGLAVAADVDHLLAGRGWPEVSPTTVLVGTVDALRRGSSPSPGRPAVPVELAGAPGAAWRAVVRPGPDDDVLDALLVSAPEQVFVTARVDGPDVDGGTAAAGRVALAEGWAVVTDLAVAPSAQRRGLARAVLVALGTWAAGRGVDRVALQVADGNDAARRLYASLGLVEHHRYAYREHP